MVRLRNYFEADKRDVKIYNLGICSETTERLLKRINIECAARDPEVVIFAIGINDSRFVVAKDESDVPIEMFKENIEKLFDRAKNFSKDIIFVGLTKITEKEVNKNPWSGRYIYRQEDVEKYNEAIEEFCEKNKVKFINILDLLGRGDLCDGLHPNSKGHSKIFKKISWEYDAMKFNF